MKKILGVLDGVYDANGRVIGVYIWSDNEERAIRLGGDLVSECLTDLLGAQVIVVGKFSRNSLGKQVFMVDDFENAELSQGLDTDMEWDTSDDDFDESVGSY